MLRTLAVILLLPGCARLAVSLNRAEEKGSKTALARAQAQLIRRVLRGETHYDVLDLPANATIEEIKAARDDLARSIHPDKLEGSPQGADAATTKLNLAYETLSDASARETYDALLSEPFARDEAMMTELENLKREKRALQMSEYTLRRKLERAEADGLRCLYGKDRKPDSHEKCEFWASAGECKKNAAYMLKYCANACDKIEYVPRGLWIPLWALFVSNAALAFSDWIIRRGRQKKMNSFWGFVMMLAVFEVLFRMVTDPTLSRKNHDWWNTQVTEFLVCSCGFAVIAELLEYVEHRKRASQDGSDGKFGDALADALAFAEDDEQAEGLSRVLEDCIGE